MNITSNEVQTQETAAQDAKKLQDASKKLFNAAIKDRSVDDLAYDKDGNLLTKMEGPQTASWKSKILVDLEAKVGIFLRNTSENPAF